MVKEPHRIITDLKKPSNGTLWVQYSNTADQDDGQRVFDRSAIHPETMERLKNRKSGPDRWVQGRYLPNDLVRLFLTITSIRVEPLQAISVDDARNEGIIFTYPYYKNYLTRELNGFLDTFKITAPAMGLVNVDAAVASYATLIERINGRGLWARNPFVWVINFEQTQKP